MQTFSATSFYSSNCMMIGLGLAMLMMCSFTHANAFYSPYAALPMASRLQYLQRQIRVPSTHPQQQQFADSNTQHSGDKSNAHQLPQQQQPMQFAMVEQNPVEKRERAVHLASYGWDQCEFSPISCLIRRRR